MKRNIIEGIINDHQPVTLWRRIQTAEYVAPWELQLTAKIGCDDALVVCPAFGILRRVQLIERMTMAEMDSFHSMRLAYGGLDLEIPMVGGMKTKNVLSPTRNRKIAAGDGGWRDHEQWRVGCDAKPILESNFTIHLGDQR
jgi:hypothetical protein